MTTVGNVGAAGVAGAASGMATARQALETPIQLDLMKVRHDLARNAENITSILGDLAKAIRDNDWKSLAEQMRQDVNSFIGGAAKLIGDGIVTLDDVRDAIGESRDAMLTEIFDIVDSIARWYSVENPIVESGRNVLNKLRGE